MKHSNFQDLVAKVKNLVALAPVLGAISRSETLCIICSKRIKNVHTSLAVDPH